VTTLSLFRCAANSNPGTGVLATGANATVLVGQSMIHSNASGWQGAAGGQLASYDDNEVSFNLSSQGVAPFHAAPL
jgi:hypothetical protein